MSSEREPGRCARDPGAQALPGRELELLQLCAVLQPTRRSWDPGAAAAVPGLEVRSCLRHCAQYRRCAGQLVAKLYGALVIVGASLSEDRIPVPSLQCLISPCSLRRFPRTGWWPLRCPGPAHHCTAQAGHPESPYPTRVLVSPSEGLFQVASPFGFKLGQ